MKKIYSLGFVLMVLFAMTMSATALEASSGSHSDKSSYGELSAIWWQWALGIPVDTNPILDTTGINCALGQSGNVWFLAGTFGGEAIRKCTVPEGKSLFFPVVNQVNLATGPTDTVKSLRATNKAFIDNTTFLEVKVDGNSLSGLWKNRAVSPVFKVNLPENNLFSLDPGKYGPTVADGYYVKVSPLKIGKHTISIHGIVNDKVNPIFETKVTYHLVVASKKR